MDKNPEMQQLNRLVTAQARLLKEFVEFSLDEANGKHSNMVYADSKVRSALRDLKRELN